jgi:LuxR family transcriptional regulator, maltose regulon positive regulatory protein
MTGLSLRRSEPLLRTRLVTETRERFTHRLVVVNAGAGFGKSTLIRQAIADNLDEPHGIDACVECVADDVHVSEFGTRLRAVLGVETAATNDPLLEAMAAADAIALRSPLDVCVIIEDGHLLKESASWPVIASLVDRLPPNGHVLISTRSDLDLPLARLLSRGQAISIDEQDLSFTEAEWQEFRKERGVELPPRGPAGFPGTKGSGSAVFNGSADSSEMVAWPALAELAVRGAGPKLQRSYLVQEVVQLLSPEVRRLLGLVIAAEGADDILASTLVGRVVNVEQELHSVPLVHVDDDGWVQPHDLWRQALGDLISADERRSAQDLAAVAQAGRGRPAQAIRLHCSAGNWAAAGRVALSALSNQPPAIGTNVLAALLDGIPTEERSHPGWQLSGALVTYERSLPAARTALERLADSLEFAEAMSVEERRSALVSTLFHLGTVGRRMADRELLLEVAERLRPIAEQRHPRALAVRASVRGFLAQSVGLCQEGLSALHDVDHGSISAEQSAHVLMMAGNLHLLDGRPDLASARYLEASGKTGGTVRLLAEELNATALWAGGFLDDAIATEQRCLDGAERLGLTSRAAQFRAMLVVMLAMTDRFDEAAQAFDSLPVQMGSRSADSETKALSLFYLALRSLHDNDELNAYKFLDRIAEPTGNLQRALFLPAATIVAVVPSRREVWSAVPAKLVQRAVALGIASLSPGATVTSVDPVESALLPRLLALPVAVPAVVAETAVTRSQVRLGLLGPVIAEPLADPAPWRRSRVRELIAAVALTGPTSREQLAELLWPDQAGGVGTRNLRVHLSYLADAIDHDRTRGKTSSSLVVQGTSIALSQSAVRIDLSSFDECRMRARAAEQDNDPAGALAALQEAVGLWRGDVAADIEAEWLDDFRRHRRAQYLAVANRAGELALSQGEIDNALGFTERVLRLDPTHERAGRLRSACLLAGGDRASAAQSIRATLAMCEELGVEPEAETVVLASRLGVD